MNTEGPGWGMKILVVCGAASVSAAGAGITVYRASQLAVGAPDFDAAVLPALFAAALVGLCLGFYALLRLIHAERAGLVTAGAAALFLLWTYLGFLVLPRQIEFLSLLSRLTIDDLPFPLNNALGAARSVLATGILVTAGAIFIWKPFTQGPSKEKRG